MPLSTINSDGKYSIQIRAFIVLILVVGATIGFFQDLITSESYMGLVMFCVGYYFGKRGSEEDVANTKDIITKQQNIQNQPKP